MITKRNIVKTADFSCRRGREVLVYVTASVGRTDGWTKTDQRLMRPNIVDSCRKTCVRKVLYPFCRRLMSCVPAGAEYANLIIERATKKILPTNWWPTDSNQRVTASDRERFVEWRHLAIACETAIDSTSTSCIVTRLR